MDIIVQSPGFKISEALDALLREKIEKLDRHTNQIIRADVMLFKGPETEQNNNYCEIRLEVPGNDHFAKKNSSSFEHAIAECVIALHHMMERTKGKEANHRQASA